MNDVLVDTSVWSLSFRHAKPQSDPSTQELSALIEDNRAFLIGPVRQELLSGIRDYRQFEELRQMLRDFPDVSIYETDYEEGAAFYNRCRAQGIQGSHIDFLICAVSARLSVPIFTTDRDFQIFQRLLPIKLHEISRRYLS